MARAKGSKPPEAGTGRILGVGLISIFALALSLRVLVVVERLGGDPYFWALCGGCDDYYAPATELLQTGVNPMGNYWLPGSVFYFYLWQLLLGTDRYVVRLGLALAGALMCVLTAYAAYLAGDDERAGVVAGVLMALYPPLIFHEQTVVTAPAATLTVVLFLVFAVKALRAAGVSAAVLWSALAGLALGYGGVTRSTVLAMAPALPLAIALADRRDLKWLRVTSSSLVILIVVMAVVFGIAKINALVSGLDPSAPLYSSPGSVIYRGNNRDASGLQYSTQAYYLWTLSGQSPIQAVYGDFLANPARMIELELHKIGLFWSDVEYANNVNFYESGVGVSRILAALSQFGMRELAFLAMTGMALMNRRDPKHVLISISVLLFMMATVAFHVLARVRVPVVPMLAVAGGLGIVRVWDVARGRNWDGIARRVLPPIVFAVAFLLICGLFEYHLPRPITVSAEAVPKGLPGAGAIFNAELMLHGCEGLRPAYTPNEQIVMRCYWEALAPVDNDYVLFVHMHDPSGVMIAQRDVRLGEVTYPWDGTSSWSPGTVYVEEYWLALRRQYWRSSTNIRVERPNLITLVIGLYTREPLRNLPLTDMDGNPSGEDYLVLRRIGLLPEEPEIPPLGRCPDRYIIGNWAQLDDYKLPVEAVRGSELSLEMICEAFSPTDEDYVLFVHVIGDDGTLVGQLDGQPDWPTSTWRPNWPMRFEWHVPVDPDAPIGTYRVLMGMYHWPDGERLSISAPGGEPVPERVIDLGRVRIVPYPTSLSDERWVNRNFRFAD